jgi:hypothetical protein
VDEKAVIDRFEDGQRAVLLVGENGRECVVPIDALPEAARPGIWLQVQFEGEVLVRASLDMDETERVQARIEDKLARLRRRGRSIRRAKHEE